MDNHNYFKQAAIKGFIINESTYGKGILQDKYYMVNRLCNDATLNDVGQGLLKRICLAYRFDTEFVDKKYKLYDFLNSMENNFFISIQDFILRYFAYTKSQGVLVYESIYRFIDDNPNPFEVDKWFFENEVDPRVFCLLFLMNDMLIHIYGDKCDEYNKNEMPVISKFVYIKNQECFVAMNEPLKRNLDEKIENANSFFNTFMKYLYDDNSILDNVNNSIKEILSAFKKKLLINGSLNLFRFFPDRYILKALCNDEELANNILLDCFIHIYDFNKRRIDPKNKKEFKIESKGYRETDNLHKVKNIIYKIIENSPEDEGLKKDFLKSYLYGLDKKQKRKYHDKSITNLLKELKRNQSSLPKNERMVKSQSSLPKNEGMVKNQDRKFINRLDGFICKMLTEEEPYSAYEFAVLFQPIDYFIDFCMFGHTDIHPSENALYPVFTGAYLKKKVFENNIHKLIQQLSKYETGNLDTTCMSDFDKEDISLYEATEQKNNSLNKRKAGIFCWQKQKNNKSIIKQNILKLKLGNALMNSDAKPDVLYNMIISDDRYYNKTHYCYNANYNVFKYAKTYSQLWNMIIAMIGEYVFNVSQDLYNLLIVKSGEDIDKLCRERADEISKKLQALWEKAKEMVNVVFEDEDYRIQIKENGKLKKKPTIKQLQNDLFVSYFKRYFEL